MGRRLRLKDLMDYKEDSRENMVRYILQAGQPYCAWYVMERRPSLQKQEDKSFVESQIRKQTGAVGSFDNYDFRIQTSPAVKGHILRVRDLKSVPERLKLDARNTPQFYRLRTINMVTIDFATGGIVDPNSILSTQKVEELKSKKWDVSVHDTQHSDEARGISLWYRVFGSPKTKDDFIEWGQREEAIADYRNTLKAYEEADIFDDYPNAFLIMRRAERFLEIGHGTTLTDVAAKLNGRAEELFKSAIKAPHLYRKRSSKDEVKKFEDTNLSQFPGDIIRKQADRLIGEIYSINVDIGKEMNGCDITPSNPVYNNFYFGVKSKREQANAVSKLLHRAASLDDRELLEILIQAGNDAHSNLPKVETYGGIIRDARREQRWVDERAKLKAEMDEAKMKGDVNLEIIHIMQWANLSDMKQAEEDERLGFTYGSRFRSSHLDSVIDAIEQVGVKREKEKQEQEIRAREITKQEEALKRQKEVFREVVREEMKSVSRDVAPTPVTTEPNLRELVRRATVEEVLKQKGLLKEILEEDRMMNPSGGSLPKQPNEGSSEFEARVAAGAFPIGRYEGSSEFEARVAAQRESGMQIHPRGRYEGSSEFEARLWAARRRK